jgi:transposase
MERKVKYDYAFKLECKLVLEKCYSCNYVSVEKGIERSNLRKWIGFYKYYGAIGLLPEESKLFGCF